MKNKTLIGLIFCLTLIVFSCSKDNAVSSKSQASVSSNAEGAVQVSGVGFIYADDPCNAIGQGYAYAISMTGDLEGCLYTLVDDYDCSPSGTYREVGREYFVGTYNGEYGTFWTNYKFEAKYEGCAENGSYVGAEIKGRCQHPLATGSGTGVFEGAKGRIAFIDDIQAGNYPYTGHFLF
jgi:hypothetical protein